LLTGQMGIGVKNKGEGALGGPKNREWKGWGTEWPKNGPF